MEDNVLSTYNDNSRKNSMGKGVVKKDNKPKWLKNEKTITRRNKRTR
jgi:hypothetical protein